MMRTVAIAAVCAVAWTAVGQTQEVSHRALAEELLVLMDVQAHLEKSFEMIRNLQVSQLNAAGTADGAVGDARQGETRQLIDRIAKELSWENLKDDYVTVYAETFSSQELGGLVAFYKSAAGRKLVAKTPELLRRSMAITQERVARLLTGVGDQTDEANTVPGE